MQIFAPISPLFNIGLSCAFFLIKSAPSRLTPNEALPQTPQGTLSLDPASPLTPGLSLRFTSRSARCWISHSGQLCQFLIPHSSSPPFFVHFALKSYQIDRINISFHKNAKNHLKPIDIPLWVWYSIDTLKHTKRLGLI